MPAERVPEEEGKERKRATQKRYYEAHKQELIARSKKWNAENRERKHATWKVWYDANRTKILAHAKAPKRTECSVHDCTENIWGPRSRAYCEAHYREHSNALRRGRRAGNPQMAESDRRYKAVNREKRNTQRQQRRLKDEAYRNRDVYLKRAAAFKAGIQRWCAEDYLFSAKREDYRYSVALRKWIKQCKQERQLLEGFDPVEAKRAAARDFSKRRYWADPEAHKLKSQTFKHARPDYRERWNAKRGRLEKELSDGTLTCDALGHLFTESVRCPYCGDPYKESRRSLDHIVPLAKAAGRKLHSITNVIVCCFTCNNKKRTKGLTKFLEEQKAASKNNAVKSREASGSLGLFASND